jgi:hypothetical protein
MTPIRNEKHEIIGYRPEHPGGQVRIWDKHGELVGWTAFGQTRAIATGFFGLAMLEELKLNPDRNHND